MNSSITSYKFSLLLVYSTSDDAQDLHQCISSCVNNQSLLPDQIVLVLNGVPLSILNQIDIPKSIKFSPVSLPDQRYLSEALNFGLKFCINDLIARIDPDDCSTKDRFKLQMNEFIKDSTLTLVGGSIACGATIKKYPLRIKNIIKYSYFKNPFAHPSVMFRKSVIISYNGYPHVKKAQDYLLWLKLIKGKENLKNIKNILVSYNTNNISSKRNYEYFKSEFVIMQIAWKDNLIPKTFIIINVAMRFITRVLLRSFYCFLYN